MLLAAQQPRQTVRLGGGPNPEIARTWPKANTKAGMTDAEVAAEAGRYIDQVGKENRFSGAVLVVHDASVLAQKAVG